MTGTVERAFRLTPECTSVEELRGNLVKEGCSNIDAHLQGSLRKNLAKLLIKDVQTNSRRQGNNDGERPRKIEQGSS